MLKFQICKHIDMCSVSVPSPQFVARPCTSCDCPTSVLCVKDYTLNKNLGSGFKTLNLFNALPFLLKPQEIKTVYFNTTIQSSLPASCVLFAPQHLYLIGISYKINIIKTNDSYLNITLFNHTCQSISVKESDLHIMCTFVLPGNTF